MQTLIGRGGASVICQQEQEFFAEQASGLAAVGRSVHTDALLGHQFHDQGTLRHASVFS